MDKDNYAAIEVYSGQYIQGFRTREEAISFIHKCIDVAEINDNYGWRVLQVLHEWDSDNLLPGER